MSWVQPDYAAWRRIRLGMSAHEVVALLGPPLERLGGLEISAELSARGASWCYGFVEVPGLPEGWWPAFDVELDGYGRVSDISTPFEGELSEDGLPTRPSILVPCAGVTFDHFPRIIDVRWTPSSGEYPMRYVLQFESRPWRTWEHHHEIEALAPHAVTELGWAGRHRVRVRAENRLGKSAWTNWRQFASRM